MEDDVTLSHLADEWGQFKVRNDAFTSKNNSRLEVIQAQIDEVQKMQGRGGLGGGGAPSNAANRHSEGLRAFRPWLSTGEEAPLQNYNSQLPRMEATVHSDPEGGYLVSPALAPAIEMALRDQSPIRGIARVVTIGEGDALEIPVDKGESVGQGWVAETEDRPATDTPEFALTRIPIHEQYSMREITQKLVDDARFDVLAWAGSRIGEEFALQEGESFVNGDGVGKPRGFLTHTLSTDPDSSRSWGEIEYLPTGTSGAFTFGSPGTEVDVLIDTVAALKRRYRQGAVWVMNRSTAATIQKFRDADGNHMTQRSIIAGQPDTLLGHEVIVADEMPDVAANSLSIAFGNFQRAYLIVDRIGIRVLRDQFTKKGYIRLYTTKRVGADLLNFECLKLVRFSAA
jgi:HK97 family phage major capsid protein